MIKTESSTLQRCRVEHPRHKRQYDGRLLRSVLPLYDKIVSPLLSISQLRARNPKSTQLWITLCIYASMVAPPTCGLSIKFRFSLGYVVEGDSYVLAQRYYPRKSLEEELMNSLASLATNSHLAITEGTLATLQFIVENP